MAPQEFNVELARCFGENMLRGRQRADLSQEELAFLSSLHRTEIGQLERGIRIPRIDTVIKLAGALQVPPGDLLKGMAWKPAKLAARGRFVTRGSGEG